MSRRLVFVEKEIIRIRQKLKHDAPTESERMRLKSLLDFYEEEWSTLKSRGIEEEKEGEEEILQLRKENAELKKRLRDYEEREKEDQERKEEARLRKAELGKKRMTEADQEIREIEAEIAALRISLENLEVERKRWVRVIPATEESRRENMRYQNLQTTTRQKIQDLMNRLQSQKAKYTRGKRTCDVCGNISRLYLCAECPLGMVYCGESCQKRDWESHYVIHSEDFPSI